MITQWLLNALAGFLSAVLSLLPAWGSFPSGAQLLGSTIGSAAAALNEWLPLVTIATGVLTLVGIRVASGLWHVIVWVWHQVPVIGGSE